MRAAIKRLLQRASPDLFRFIQIRYRRLHFRFSDPQGFRAKQALRRRYGTSILTGPFQGMQYGDDVVYGAFAPKLIGIYEEELHSVIEEIIRRRYSIVVNVGCGEGYYSVGLASRMPDTAVYAFDTDSAAQRYCADLAKLNSVSERVHVRGLCSHRELQQLGGRDSIIICDCEGFEETLLDPDLVPQLASTDVLVELHEFIKPGITNTILSRFRNTHALTLIDAKDRDPEKYPLLRIIRPPDRYSAVDEHRPAAMQWAFLRSNGQDGMEAEAHLG
jgi:hypothetical protein